MVFWGMVLFDGFLNGFLNGCFFWMVVFFGWLFF